MTPVPLWLAAECDRIIKTRRWQEIRNDIMNPRIRHYWPHRAVLALHLQEFRHGGLQPTGEEIAACIGMLSRSSVNSAARLYTKAEAELKKRKEWAWEQNRKGATA